MRPVAAPTIADAARRPRRRNLAGRLLAYGAAGAAALCLATGCGSARSAAPTAVPVPAVTVPVTTPPTTVAPTSSTTDRHATTTTVRVPVAPQPSAADAAAALMSGWSTGNRPVARSVATSRAVATLFAVRYQPGQSISRQCTTAFPPIICSYGPPGGGPVGDPLFQLYLAHTSKGWYVSSVVIER
jgi:hypothetical protein